MHIRSSGEPPAAMFSKSASESQSDWSLTEQGSRTHTWVALEPCAELVCLGVCVCFCSQECPEQEPAFVGSSVVSEGFPGGSSGKELACQFRRHKRHRFDPLIGKIPWRRKWQLTPVFLPGESHGQRSLSSDSP